MVYNEVLMAKAIPIETTLTVPEAAKVLKCSTKTVYRLISKRAIPFVKLGYRTVRLPSQGVEEFIGKMNAASRPTPGRWWVERGEYYPEQMTVAYNKILAYIRDDGDEVLECRLQFETVRGRTYIAKLITTSRR
jgi:excisionase family DNA binding protein